LSIQRLLCLLGVLCLALGCPTSDDDDTADDDTSDDDTGDDDTGDDDTGDDDTGDDDTSDDDDSAYPCEESTEGTAIAATGDLTVLFASQHSDRALLVTSTWKGPTPQVYASMFDGTDFGVAVEIVPPVGIEIIGGAVSACLAGPDDRPFVAFDGSDVDGFRNLLAVGDGLGGFLDPVLVEDEPMTPMGYGAPYLVCDPGHDRAVVVTMPGSGALWVDGWTGAAMLGPEQVIPQGSTRQGPWYVSGFGQNGRAVIATFTDDGGGSYPLLGTVFSGAAVPAPQTLYTASDLNPTLMYAAASRHADRGLIVFTDDSSTYQAIRQTGETFGAPTALDDAGNAEGRARAYFFRNSDRAAITYETASGDVRVVLDDGATFDTPVTVGQKAPMGGFHTPFLRFRSAPSSDRAFVLFDGDATGGDAISVAPFDGSVFLPAQIVSDDPEYVTAFGEFAGAGDTALIAYQTLSKEDGARTYAAPLDAGVVGTVERVDCGEKNYSIGDFGVTPSLTAERFTVPIGWFNGMDTDGTHLRLMEDGAPGLGLLLPYARVVALADSDRILVVKSDGGALEWETR